MKTKTAKTKPARVTMIEVSRLYNLGNYQNVSYRIAAEVPKGASAKNTLATLAHIVAMLQPIPRPGCLDQYLDAIKKDDTARSTYEKENLADWSERVAAFRAKELKRDTAIETLDELGGTRTFKDAKNEWEDPDGDTPF